MSLVFGTVKHIPMAEQAVPIAERTDGSQSGTSPVIPVITAQTPQAMAESPKPITFFLFLMAKTPIFLG